MEKFNGFDFWKRDWSTYEIIRKEHTVVGKWNNLRWQERKININWYQIK
jgi:hypothetical protein